MRSLELTGAGWLAPRLDEHANWEEILAANTQQQLSFARALMLQPEWIFMQEATDSFDADGERAMFEMLHRELPGTTLLTLGLHAGLEAAARAQDRADARQEYRKTEVPTAATAKRASPPLSGSVCGSQPRSTHSRKLHAGVVSVR